MDAVACQKKIPSWCHYLQLLTLVFSLCSRQNWRVWDTHVVASEDSQVEGQQLQWDDAQDALQAVHAVRHFDGVARVLDGLVIFFVADHDGASLPINKHGVSSVNPSVWTTRMLTPVKNHICCTLLVAMMSPRTAPSLVFIGVRDQMCAAHRSLKYTLTGKMPLSKLANFCNDE